MAESVNVHQRLCRQDLGIGGHDDPGIGCGKRPYPIGLLPGQYGRAELALRIDIDLRLQVEAHHPGIDPVRDLEPGLGDASVGIATRYEFRREFAPYINVRWTRRTGDANMTEVPGGRDVTGWTLRGGLWLMF